MNQTGPDPADEHDQGPFIEAMTSTIPVIAGTGVVLSY
jgi:hypothetical protein